MWAVTSMRPPLPVHVRALEDEDVLTIACLRCGGTIATFSARGVDVAAIDACVTQHACTQQASEGSRDRRGRPSSPQVRRGGGRASRATPGALRTNPHCRSRMGAWTCVGHLTLGRRPWPRPDQVQITVVYPRPAACACWRAGLRVPADLPYPPARLPARARGRGGRPATPLVRYTCPQFRTEVVFPRVSERFCKKFSPLVVGQ